MHRAPSIIHALTTSLLALLISATVLADPPNKEKRSSKEEVRGSLFVDYLKLRSTARPVIECDEQDFPVFGVDVKVYNLGPGINSRYSDYNPVLDRKESFMLFTSRRRTEMGEEMDIDGQYFEKVFISRKEDGEFRDAKPLDKQDSIFGRLPSSDRHESLIFLSYSEDLLITYTDEKLYYSNRIGDFYTEPVEFPKIINKGKWKRHASITEDGRKLYFTTESVSKENKNLNLDIWEIERKDDGTWMKPVQLPSAINSPYNEDSPEISPDGRFLFFSSNRVGGMGGYDVYMAEFKDGEWQLPKNLCKPINTAADDIYFKLSRNGNYAYYSSNVLGGQGNMDIYKVVLDVPSIATCGSYSYGRRSITFSSPFEISFYGEGKEFFWVFGDGQSAQGSEVTHEYATDGDYDVVLYVREKSSQRIVNTVFSKTVRVDTENSAVDILGPDTVEIGHEIHFNGSESYVEGSPASAFYWKVDGQLVSREPEINYSFSRVGKHKVELEVGVLDERIMELSSACIAREIEVVTPVVYQELVGAQEGSESFSYTDLIPDQVLADLEVTQKANILELQNDYISTWEDEAKAFSVFENDRTPGIDLDKVVAVSKPAYGNVKVKNENYGLLVYEPYPGFVGYDKFEYTARSKNGKTSSATVVISVKDWVDQMIGQNVTNDEYTIDGDEPTTLFPLQNDEHALGAEQKLVDISQPSNGVVQQIGLQGLIEYTPNASFQGSDAFTYTLEDERGERSTASVIIKSADVTKTDMYANPDYVELDKDEKARVKVLQNDVFSGPVSVVDVSSASHGSCQVINPRSGDIFYGPEPGFVGTDAFTYTIEDADGNQSVSSVTLVIKEKLMINKPLVIETYQYNPTIAFIFKELNVPKGYEIVSQPDPQHGKAEIADSKEGIITYTPDDDFTGFDMFFIDIRNDDGDELEIGLIAKVLDQTGLMAKYGLKNNKHFANVKGITLIDPYAFTYGKLEKSEKIIDILDENDAVRLEEGKIAFDYSKLDQEQHAITFLTQDDEGNFNVHTVFVNPVDELGIPIITKLVMTADLANTQVNKPVTIAPLLNDRHLNNKEFKIVSLGEPHNGTTILEADKGTVLYVPNLDYNGTDAFTYTIEDEDGVRSTSAVSIVVLTQVEYALEEKGYNPKLSAFDYIALQPDEQTFDPEQIVDVSSPMFGSVDLVNANTGEMQYTPNEGFEGVDRYSFTMHHSDGTNTSHRVVAVVDERDEFMEGAREATMRTEVYSDELILFYPLMNKIHPYGKSMRLVSIESAQGAVITEMDEKAFSYRPPKGYAGLDRVDYIVMDEDGNLQRNSAFVEVLDDGTRAEPETIKLKTPVNVPLSIALRDRVPGMTYLDHTSPYSGSIELLSDENLVFEYQASTQGVKDQFTVVVRSSSDEIQVLEVEVEASSPVDVSSLNKSFSDVSIASIPESEELLAQTLPSQGLLTVEGNSIQYAPYNNAKGKDRLVYMVQAGSEMEQRSISFVHAKHERFVPKTPHVLTIRQDPNEPLLLYAFSVIQGAEQKGLTISKHKSAKEGSSELIDAELGIIRYVPNPEEQEDEFSYTIQDASKNKQEVIVYINLNEPSEFEAPTLTVNASTEHPAFDYELMDYLEEQNATLKSVTGHKQGSVNVINAETALFSYTPNAGFVGTEYLIAEIELENGEQAFIPVQTNASNESDLSAANLTYKNVASVEADRKSYHTVLESIPDAAYIVSSGGAKAGNVTVTDANSGVLEYAPYPGFVGEDSYWFEYTTTNGDIIQREMKVFVRDGSAEMISMSELKRQSASIEEKQSNVSESLALAQEESIARGGASTVAVVPAVAPKRKPVSTVTEDEAADDLVAAREQEERERLEAEAQRKADEATQLAAAEKTKKEAEAKRVEEERIAQQKAAEERLAQQKAEEKTKQTTSSDKVVFRNILFDFDKSDLRPLSEEELMKIYSYLESNPYKVLQLDGHADWIGTVEYNLGLSERRAKQAYEFLIAKGVGEERMNYQFYGEAVPVAPNANADGSDNPQGRQLNRRVEFKVKDEGTADIKLKF